MPSDFHPHWHINRPLSDIEYVPPTPVILDPIDRHLRRTQETERRAHARANNRLRLAQTGRILSQFEQRQGLKEFYVTALPVLNLDMIDKLVEGVGQLVILGVIVHTCPGLDRC